jgi:hypothetical protein
MTLLSAVVGAILGAIIGGICTYLGAVRMAGRERLLDAGRRLREAFQLELAVLEGKGDKVNTSVVLENAFQKHLIAVNDFRYALTGCKRDAFNQAWEQYHCTDSGNNKFIHSLDQYGGFPSERDENRKLAIDKINHILSFTV